MAGNGKPIDLNSDVVHGDREFEGHGFNSVEPVSDALNEESKSESPSKNMDFGQTKAESSSNDFGEDEVNDVQEITDSEEGLCRLDKDEADANMEYEAASKEFLEGISLDNVEMKHDVTESGEEIGDEPSIALNELSGVERECSERLLVSEEIPVGCGDEIMTDDNDATNVHHIEHNVEIPEGICPVQNEEGQVVQDGELAFGSVKCDQIMKHDKSYELLDHGVGVVDSVPLHDNLGSDASADLEDTRQLTEKLSQKAENLMERNELSPVAATDRTVPALDCSKNQTEKIGGGETDEKDAAGFYFLKTEGSIDVDETNLFDVVIEMDPHAVMDEEGDSDYIAANSTDLEFKISDLVWGKVRSHPWWPGQICDPSASSKKAMKYFKQDRYLVAFFGDHSFSWKEASMIKPFQECFSMLEKQSELESFHRALNCSLEEFSRRIEFGLACSCLSEELYSKLQIQTLTNAGIRKKASKIYGGDSSLTASSFDAVKLINIVREVARTPYGETDRLELVRALAQLKAFNRWKGCYELPEFNIHKVVLNYTEENDYQSELLEDITKDVKDDEVAPHGRRNLKTEDSSSGKRKRNSENSECPKKKGKKLSDLMSKESHHILNVENASEENAGSKLNLHASCLKNQVVDAIFNNPTAKPPVTHVSTQSANELVQNHQTFRVGDRIRRVACKLNESSPIFKHGNGVSQKTVAVNKENGNMTKIANRERLCMECPLDEVFSQLRLAAINPMKGLGFLNTIINFFSEFRNFICRDVDLTNLTGQEMRESVAADETGNKLTMTGKRKKISASTEGSDSEFIKDSYWTDRLIQGIAEDQLPLENKNETAECKIQTSSEKSIPTVKEQDGQLSSATNYQTDRLIQGIAEDQLPLENKNETAECQIQTPSEKGIATVTEQEGQLSPATNYRTDRLIQGIAEDQLPLEKQNETAECQIQTPSEKGIPTVKEQDGQLSPATNCTNQGPHEHAELESENPTEDVYPTALILNFTDLASVPLETNLNDIFRKYGALYESKTEIMKKSKRAKVVFKRSSDAETAFSSAGKYSIFGPSLVSYRLKYLPPFKDSPAKRRRKGLESQEEITT